MPTKGDVFSYPYLANISVGSPTESDTRGFNICTRIRALDAIPFAKKLVVDMEVASGHDQRNAWDWLGYSAVTFWYAMPGARSNRPPLPEEAAQPIMSLDQLDRLSDECRVNKNPWRPSGSLHDFHHGPHDPWLGDPPDLGARRRRISLA